MMPVPTWAWPPRAPAASGCQPPLRGWWARQPPAAPAPSPIGAPEHEARLRPDDLAADDEAGGLEALDHRPGVHAGMPDPGQVAGEQRPGLAPAGVVVIRHLAAAHRGRDAGTVPPFEIMVRAAGSVRDHQVQQHIIQQLGDVRRAAGIAAQQPVRPAHPEIGVSGDGGLRLLPSLGVRTAASSSRRIRRRLAEQPVQRRAVEADLSEVEFAGARHLQLGGALSHLLGRVQAGVRGARRGAREATAAARATRSSGRASGSRAQRRRGAAQHVERQRFGRVEPGREQELRRRMTISKPDRAPARPGPAPRACLSRQAARAVSRTRGTATAICSPSIARASGLAEVPTLPPGASTVARPSANARVRVTSRRRGRGRGCGCQPLKRAA